jgi:hypothetical protein
MKSSRGDANRWWRVASAFRGAERFGGRQDRPSFSDLRVSALRRPPGGVVDGRSLRQRRGSPRQRVVLAKAKSAAAAPATEAVRHCSDGSANRQPELRPPTVAADSMRSWRV